MKNILMLTTVALLGSTALVAAQETTATDNAFGLAEVQEDNQLIVLPLVTATADGTVEIRGIAGEQEGEVFGSQVVTAGANENVRVSLLAAPNADAVLAVLVVDGVDVATQEIRLSPPGGDSNRGGGEEDGGDEGESGTDTGNGDNDGNDDGAGSDDGSDNDAGGDDAGGEGGAENGDAVD